MNELNWPFTGLVSISGGGFGNQPSTRYYDDNREISKEEYERLRAERHPSIQPTTAQRIERWLSEAGCFVTASGWEWNGNVVIATDLKGKPAELPIEMAPRHRTVTFTDDQLKAFVSLIVEDCAAICTGPGYEDSMVGIELALAIRERFKP